MTSEKSGQTKGKRPVGPWTRIDSERERWVRLIVGDSAGDHAALVSFGAGDTWWRVYRADEPQRAHAEGDVDDIEAGKAAADSHLEAAGWTIGTVATSAADGHFTTNETTEWDELSKPEAGLRAAINRDRWLKMGPNGARYFEPGFAHSADRENYLLNEHERLTEVINGARQALDECGAPTHTPHGRLLGLGGRVFAMFEQSLVEPVKPVTRPKVSGFHQRGAGGYVVDDHGQEAGAVWQCGDGWGWQARRALLPSLSAHDAATKDEAQAACLAVLRTWADVDGEPARALSVGEVFAAASGPGESGSLVGEGSTGPLRKAWNEWCHLSAEPIRTDAQEAECRFWRCLLDEAGIETWDAVPREEIPPHPGDVSEEPVSVSPAPPAGFAGTRVRGFAEAHDGDHVVRLAIYRFADGSEVPYVEAYETHDGARPGQVMALSTLVHLVQNATDAEVWTIGARVQPHSAVPGETCQPCTEALGDPSPCAMSHDVGPGAYGLVDLAEAMESAGKTLATVGCTGDSLEEQAEEAAREIRRLREANGSAWGILTELRESVKRWKALAGEAPTPKAIEPAGPLSVVVAVGEAGHSVVLRRSGPWGSIDETPFPGADRKGLYLWTGKAEAERDEQVGGWDFIGEWTALPLPVLP